MLRSLQIAAAGSLFLVAPHDGSAQPPSSQAGRPDNPALARFNPAITFYLSFDSALRADVAKGKPDPTNAEGVARFLPGLYGRALMLTEAAKPGTGIHVSYPTLDNVDVTRPGSLAVWLSPRDWVRSSEEDYFWPVKIMAGNGLQLMFGRQGQLLNPTRRTDMLYLWAKLGETKDLCVVGGDSLRWKNGEWHLWIMNWRSGSVEFSMDGGPLQHQDLPAKIGPGGNREGQMYIGASSPRCRYLLDELIALDRPLDNDEIKWLYQQGMKAAQPLLP